MDLVIQLLGIHQHINTSEEIETSIQDLFFIRNAITLDYLRKNMLERGFRVQSFRYLGNACKVYWSIIHET